MVDLVPMDVSPRARSSKAPAPARCLGNTDVPVVAKRRASADLRRLPMGRADDDEPTPGLPWAGGDSAVYHDADFARGILPCQSRADPPDRPPGPPTTGSNPPRADRPPTSR